MKNKLTIVLIFLALIYLYAQKFEIGVNGGESANYVLRSTYPWYTHAWNGPNVPYLSVKGIRANKYWQMGIVIDYCPVSVTYTYTIWPDLYTGPTPPAPITFTRTERSHCFPVRFFADRKWTLGHIETYAGLSVGYILSHGTSIESIKSILPYVAGIHFGCTYFVTRNLGFNVDAGGDYLSWISNYGTIVSNISVPVTCGLRYKL